MFSMNIQGENVYLSDISYADLDKIVSWYNKVEHFKYATGRDMPMDMEDFVSIYEELLKSDGEFFAGIYKKEDSQMIGILKGKLETSNKRKVFISLIVIDRDYQSKGFGRETINLSLLYLKNFVQVSEVFLAVVEGNKKGREFWEMLGFTIYKRMNNHVIISQKQCDVIIMKRKL